MSCNLLSYNKDWRLSFSAALKYFGCSCYTSCQYSLTVGSSVQIYIHLYNILSLFTVAWFNSFLLFELNSLTYDNENRHLFFHSVCSPFYSFRSVCENEILRSLADPTLLIGYIAGSVFGVFTSKCSYREFCYDTAVALCTLLHRFLPLKSSSLPFPADYADGAIDFASHDVFLPS